MTEPFPRKEPDQFNIIHTEWLHRYLFPSWVKQQYLLALVVKENVEKRSSAKFQESLSFHLYPLCRLVDGRHIGMENCKCI